MGLEMSLYEFRKCEDEELTKKMSLRTTRPENGSAAAKGRQHGVIEFQEVHS